MLMKVADFRHYTDDELLSFITTRPDHLAAEGELVRRVVSDEWLQDERDAETDKLETQLEELEEKRQEAQSALDTALEEADDLKEQLKASEARYTKLRESMLRSLEEETV